MREAFYQAGYQSPESGWISSINALEIGLAAVILGAGRQQAEDTIDYRAGIRLYAKPGQKIEKGDLLFSLYSEKEGRLPPALEKIASAVSISDSPVQMPKLIHTFLDKSGI